MPRLEKTIVSGSRVLTQETIDALKKEAERYKNAQRQVTEGLAVLWNAQLDIAVINGDADRIDYLIGHPVGVWDDCDCNKKSCTPTMPDPSWWAQVGRQSGD